MSLRHPIDELRADLEDARRDSRELSERVAINAEAHHAQMRALAVNRTWERIYEQNLAEALSEGEPQAAPNSGLGEERRNSLPSPSESAKVVELPVCHCGHYERQHAPGGYGGQSRGGCLNCPCDRYAGP